MQLILCLFVDGYAQCGVGSSSSASVEFSSNLILVMVFTFIQIKFLDMVTCLIVYVFNLFIVAH